MNGNSNSNVVAVQDYALLKDLKVEFSEESNGCLFSICLWLYLTNPTDFPSTILHQVLPDIKYNHPFLLLNEEKKLMLFPVHNSQNEAPTSDNPVLSASSQVEFPMNKWVHIGCEVSSDFVRLHINGEVAGEKSLSSSPKKVSSFLIIGDNSGPHNYICNVEVLPLTSNIKSHYLKVSPLQLLIDYSSVSELEEDTDGVWIIVGGKASCRRIFSLDVTLLNAFNQSVNKEAEVLASLVYFDNEAPVERTNDDEAPLLASYDGIEFPSLDKPSKLLNSRASFKLKISQLSSKCDNRLFRVKFEIPKTNGFSFLKALSRPIRCISRSRNTRTSPLTLKKTPLMEDGVVSEALPYIIHEPRPSPLSKRVKLGYEKEQSFHMIKDDHNVVSFERRLENNHDSWESVSSHSEDSETTHLNQSSVSDLIVFKYCLGGLSERSLLLREIAISAGEGELGKFADQVSQYSGCSHHRSQIIISKRLMEEGLKTWSLISQNNHHVLWESLLSGVQEQFMKISFSSRPLTHQDFKVLRRISGCQELVSQENFEKLWCWLYPVALSLSQEHVNPIWECATPKWIEGFITKEEAEISLKSSSNRGGVVDPGTFILRFPISRSWPHPDAGNLVVTYVGNDFMIHHRLLSRDRMNDSSTMKPLHQMLREVPELSRLGRVVRSSY